MKEEGDHRIFGKEIWRSHVVSMIQVQLEKDGGGSTRQSWMETRWYVAYVFHVFHWERQGIKSSQVIAIFLCSFLCNGGSWSDFIIKMTMMMETAEKITDFD